MLMFIALLAINAVILMFLLKFLVGEKCDFVKALITALIGALVGVLLSSLLGPHIGGPYAPFLISAAATAAAVWGMFKTTPVTSAIIGALFFVAQTGVFHLLAPILADIKM